MRYYWLLLFMGLSWGLTAQDETAAVADEEIFKVVDEMPRFPGCDEETGLSKEELNQCAQKQMLEFIYSNITYPAKAREEGTEGTAVVRFVVKKDGTIADATVVREIGNGCGEEALRVVELMREQQMRWTPGKQKGEPVNVYFNLPVKYKLEDDVPPPPPPPYIIMGQDTIYTVVDEVPVFGKSKEDLDYYLATELKYPAGVDSCVAGAFVLQLFISREGEVVIGDVYDYSNLGFDFQFEAIRAMNATTKKWQAAKFDGRDVHCYVPVRVVFKPQTADCKTTADNFDAAYTLTYEGEQLYAEAKPEEAIAKWDRALELMPGNAEILLLRGQALLETNQQERACSDLREAQKVVPLATWVEQALPFICKD